VKEQVPSLVKTDGTLTSDDQQAAKVLCDYFKEVFTREIDKKAQEQLMAIDGDSGDDQIVFDVNTVKRQLQTLKPDKSPGPDGIHPLVLKECAETLAKPLTIIFQTSFDNGKLHRKTGNLRRSAQSTRKERRKNLKITDQFPSRPSVVR